MNKKIVMIAAIVSVALVITLVIVFLPPATAPGERKAIIVCSANDFYGTETEDSFNGGPDSSFEGDTGNWQWTGVNATGSVETGPQVLQVVSDGINSVGQYIYNWSQLWGLKEYAFYNLSTKFFITSPINGGFGVKIGLQWLNSSSEIVRTDWSRNISKDVGVWLTLNISGVCNNDTNNEMTEMKLVFAVEGTWAVSTPIQFDDVKMDRWIAVNVTNPTNPNPPPSKVDADGFPAQALHIYWILKDHGYTDDNIFLMLYHKNDLVIDIKLGDGIANDLTGAVIDVEDDDVNASRVKHELNISALGSFASNIQANDQLIIYMGDHGSNAFLPDKNATFHFEADNSFITEFEFYNLVSKINCQRMMINIDCCFSGNFLNANASIGSSWYDLPNAVMVSASANIFSWYWAYNTNPDGFAGSWFFHQFWEQLDQGQAVAAAYNFAINWIPAGRVTPLAGIQAPMMQDNIGISNIWSFNSVPSL